MESLPPIHEMYSSLKQQKDYDVTRKYQTTRIEAPTKKSPTKKGSYLDDAIKMSSSPGPANKSNIQGEWAKPCKNAVKYADRRTYVDEIQAYTKKKNSPSPNHYNVEMDWPEKTKKIVHESEKINFLDHSQFQSNQTPGPGNYQVGTNIIKKVKEYHHTENKPLQPRNDKSADMTTYDPVPVAYATFKKYEKEKPKGSISSKKEDEAPKKQKENSVPGPGHYQVIHTWAGKDQKQAKGSSVGSSCLDKISRRPTPNVYYH